MKPFQEAGKLLRVLYSAPCTAGRLTLRKALTFRGRCRRLPRHAPGGVYFATNAGSRSGHMLIFNSSTHDLSANAVAVLARRLNHVMASAHWLWLGQRCFFFLYTVWYFLNCVARWISVVKILFMTMSNRSNVLLFPAVKQLYSGRLLGPGIYKVYLFIYQQDIPLARMKVKLLTIEIVTPEKFYCHLVI